MQYATLGRTRLKVSRLGFGCMRLPMKSRDEVDRDLAIPMLRRAFELGVTYFDTAVGYCGGDSQRVLGEATEDIRDKVVLSTKNPFFDKADKARWWRNLEDSLKFLRTDAIDVYNFHGIDWTTYENSIAGEDGLYKEMLKAKEQGMIRHICHSFHGSLDDLKKLVDTGLFESITLQYNLLDQSMEEGITYAHAHGMGVVVMGPVGGGRLGYPSAKAAVLVGEVQSTPELALRFVLSNEAVTIALSGMSEMQHVEENVATVERGGRLSLEDHKRIEAAVRERKELAGLYCTGCNYCMPCPEGVDIPANFEILNMDRVFGLTDLAKKRYAALAGKAALCRLCGKCVEPCPQDLAIPARLAEAVQALDERAGRVTAWTELRGGRMDEIGLLDLKLRMQLKNFTAEDHKVRVELQPHGEDQLSPASFSVKSLAAYGRRHKDLEMRVLPGSPTLDFDAVLWVDGAPSFEHFHHIVTTARRAEGYTLDADARRSGARHVPTALHPIYGTAGAGKGHSFDFALAYDDENLYVYADVEDDLLCAKDGMLAWYEHVDNLSIFLDGRKPARIGHGGYEDGVVHFAVYVPQSDVPAPFVRAWQGRVEPKVRLHRTAQGYRVDCAVPWKVFCEGGRRPDVIGFDIVQASFDADGEEVVSLAWTGRTGQGSSSGAFGKLLLI